MCPLELLLSLFNQRQRTKIFIRKISQMRWRGWKNGIKNIARRHLHHPRRKLFFLRGSFHTFLIKMWMFKKAREGSLYDIPGSLLLQKLMKYTNFNNFLHAMLIMTLSYAFLSDLIYNLIKLEKNKLFFCVLTPLGWLSPFISNTTYYNEHHTCMHAHIHQKINLIHSEIDLSWMHFSVPTES